MKITRLKRGYRIGLTDTEFEALCVLVNKGQTDFEGVDISAEYGSVYGKPVARLLEQGRFSFRAAMQVDEDRR